MGEISRGNLHQEKHKKANEHRKRFSISLAIREMKIRTTGRDFSLTRLIKT